MFEDELRPFAGIALAVQVALAAFVWHEGRAEAPAPVVAHVQLTLAPQLNITVHAPVVAPVPAPVSVLHASCPPPRKDAPWVEPHLDEDITGVRPAPTNAGWVAAWNDHHVFVSYDAGATFTRVLDGDGKVQDVSFDCFGHAIAMRGNLVGVRDGAHEHWAKVPGLRGQPDDPGGVLGGGPDVVVVGIAGAEDWQARLAVSSDQGGTWSFHDLSSGFESGMKLRGREWEDGGIDAAVALADCMNDDLRWTRIRNGKSEELAGGMWEGASFAVYDTIAVDNRQWRTLDGEWHDLPAPPSPDNESWGYTIVPGAFPVLLSGDKTFRFAGGQLRTLPVIVEGEPMAVDPAGRIWSVACGKPLVAKRTATGLPTTCAASD